MDTTVPVKQYNKLREQVNPNIEELENFVKAAEKFRFCNKDSQNINALRLKYQAMTTVPTTIEKTMSPYQLYATNNRTAPLWFNGYMAHQKWLKSCSTKWIIPKKRSKLKRHSTSIK